MNIKRMIAILISVIMLCSCSGSGKDIKTTEMNEVKKEGKQFLNAEETKMMTGFSWSSIREQFFGEEKVPGENYNFQKFQYKDEGELLAVTWFGHSSTFIQLEGKNILTDPMFSTHAGPVKNVGSKRFNKQVPLLVEQLPAIDIVLISHDHFDHLDKASVKALDAKSSCFLVPTGIDEILLKWHIAPDKIHTFTWWQELELEGLKIAFTPTRHFSGRIGGRNRTLWGSWCVLGREQSVYFSGDSGYQKDFKKIGEKYGPFDLSILECGQYSKDWSQIHMHPSETVQAGLDLKSKCVLPIHWGAFSLSTHKWYEPIEVFVAEAQKKKLRYVTPSINKTIAISENITTAEWWKEYK